MSVHIHRDIGNSGVSIFYIIALLMGLKKQLEYVVTTRLTEEVDAPAGFNFLLGSQLNLDDDGELIVK
jgi:hypothetical protein